MKQAEDGEKAMQLSGALAAFPDDGDVAASQPDDKEAEALSRGGASGVLGASWLVVLQETLIWPFALAAAFAWMLS